MSSDLNTRQFFTAGVLELVDALHQGFSFRFFLGSGFCVPGSAPKDLCGTIKGSDAILLVADVFFLDVQPLFAPPLNGVGEFDVEVIDVGSDADANAAHVVDDIARAIAPEIKNAFPQAPVGMGPEEAFAQGNKYRDVEDRVGGQMMQLNSVNKEKSTEKFVDGGGKAANEVVDESYPKSNWRGWKAFVAREDQRVLLLHQAQLLEDPLVLVGDLGSLPSRDLHLLHWLLGP